MKPKVLDETTRALLDRARRYCALNEQCESGVRQKLISWGAPPDSLDTIVNLLRADDYLNDVRYARIYCENKILQQHWSRQKVLYQLRSKQLSKDSIEEGLSNIDPAEYMRILAEEANKKLQSMGGELTLENHRKLTSFLTSRGYTAEEINKALADDFPPKDNQ